MAGRPSVARERRAQIFEAALACIRRDGIVGTTLEGIAREAGMSRGHVRHFAGNRDDIIVGAARHFYADESPTDAGRAASVPEVLDHLFGSEFTRPDDDNRVVHRLIDASRTLPALAGVLVEAYGSMQTDIERAIAAEAPEGDASARDDVAYAVLCLALGNVFVADYDEASARHAVARAAAQALIDAHRAAAGTPPPGARSNA